MADTAARLAICARRNEVARFTIAVTGIDLTGVAMAMQIRLGLDVPGAPLISLATVTTLAAEGLKLDSVTTTNGVPTSVIKGRINASTMTDATKVPYTGEVGDNTVLAYAMQWTIAGDAQTRLYGDFIVVASAFGSDAAPTNRPASYGSPSTSCSTNSGSLTFGDQIIVVTIAAADLVGIEVAKAKLSAGFATWPALQAYAPQMATGDRTSVSAADTGTHAAVAGDVGTVSGQTPNGGVYVKVSGVDLPVRAASTDGQTATAQATLAGHYANDATDTDVSGGAAGSRGAAFYAQQAKASVATMGISTAPLANVVDTDQDVNGRWWVQKRQDGSTRIQKPCDALGNRLDVQIAALATRASALEAASLLQPPISRLRLKKALYNGGLIGRVVMASDPVTVGAYGTGATTLSNPTVIGKSDPRVRLFGGKWLAGSGVPGSSGMYPQAITRADPTTINAATGLPVNRGGNAGDLDFMLPAGVTTFELVVLGQGASGNFFIDIDGVGTNAAGYTLPPANTGQGYYVPIQLPASASDRRVHIIMPFRPFAGITVQSGGTIAAYSPPQASSMVFVGDSITEQAVASSVLAAWIRVCAAKLGIDNAINIGIGSSGYRAKPNGTGYNFREHIGDVLTAVNGGPPDAVVIAGGINDTSVAPGGPYTAEQVGAEALLYFQQLRSAAPDMAIYVLGPFTDYLNPSYSATLYACRDAIFAAAAKVPRVHTIDVSDWVTPANKDTVFAGTTNGPHPVDGGHAIYGARAASAIASYINSY